MGRLREREREMVRSVMGRGAQSGGYKKCFRRTLPMKISERWNFNIDKISVSNANFENCTA